LTANLRMDLAAKSPDIRVTLVMPGVVTTDFSRNVVGEARAPLAGGKGPPSQTPEEVAKVVAAVIRSPVAEVYTNPASAPTVKAYQEDIVAFEARLRAP
jgi:NADP-dependent 3-hydroxy acid dehydrogenase YdfG